MAFIECDRSDRLDMLGREIRGGILSKYMFFQLIYNILIFRKDISIALIQT